MKTKETQAVQGKYARKDMYKSLSKYHFKINVFTQ